MKTFENPLLEEIHQARQRLVERFGGDARAYCDDVIRRSMEREQSGQTWTDETKDVENPGQGTEPWRDPIVEEIHQIRAKIAAEHNNDSHAMFADAQKRDKARVENGGQSKQRQAVKQKDGALANK
jgi:hypothetical protein